MKDLNDCANHEEIESEWQDGQKRFKELLSTMLERQKVGDFRMSYSGLREMIDALELNEFILENTEDNKGV